MNTSQSRKSAVTIPLCDSLVLKYTASVTKAPTDKYKTGFYNAVRFYFYMPKLKKQIGKDWETNYKVTKRALTMAEQDRPTPSKITEHLIQTGIENLLNRNAGLSLKQRKTVSKKTKVAELDADELLVFWLTHFDEICAEDTSLRTASDLNKTFAKLCREVASFRLTTLATNDRTERSAACRDLASRIKKALRHKDSDTTSNIKDKTQVIRFAVKVYLREQNIDPGPVLEELIKLSTPKKGVVAKVSENMRLQSISIDQYRELYSALTENPTADDMALLLMIFLGLKAEEVCGLRQTDVKSIVGYSGCYQLRIVREYRKNTAGRYAVKESDDEKDFRNIPLPRPIYKWMRSFITEQGGYLFTRNGRPLKPDELTKQLEQLLKTAPNILSVVDSRGKVREVNTSFLPSSYRVSCRYYWQYHCGLTAGEIRYLAAMAPPDTVSAHYIDFNNATMQFRMLKQLEYGLALFANDDADHAIVREWTSPDKKSFYVSGDLAARCSMQLHITEPAQLTIDSNRGILLSKRAKE